ncbi:MAG: hypothetical protein DLM69_02285 [Candidatus Chloroheliales bacterium]|nr:MAG: hypothetical protein DLM69_02285 [Chloroflexota bacterium]
MPNLPRTSGKEVLRGLAELNCIVLRQTGSHVRVERHKGDRMLLSTVPLHKTVPVGTLAKILRDLEITPEEFIAALKG